MTPEVVVVGAGICGAACALELHDRDADVLLLDRGEVSSGTTGLGEGNVLEPDGYALWHELAERFPDAVKLRAKGSLILFEDEGARTHGGEVVEDPRTLEPALAPGLPPAVFVPGDLQVDPRSTARAMAAEVPVRTGANVVQAHADGVVLDTGERIAADAVVVATGPWSSALVPELDVRPRKGQLVALGPAPGLVHHKVYEAAYPAPIASVIEEALTGEVYVGSSRQDVGFDTSPDPAVTQRLLQRAYRWMPTLADLPVTRTWAGLRPALEGGPFAGRLPSGVYALTGHEGSGVALGPITARRLAEQLL